MSSVLSSAGAIEWLVAALVLIGALFLLVGAVGLVRFPDLYMRLHAPTKASTLGVGGVLLASLLWRGWQGDAGLHELLITLFVFITAPVSANLIAQAALHCRVPSRAAVPPEVAALTASAPATATDAGGGPGH